MKRIAHSGGLMRSISAPRLLYGGVVVAILILGFFLRSGMFIHGDLYILPDQGRDLELVKQIVVDHKLTLIGGRAGIGGLFHGPLWFYMLAPFFLLSQGNPFYTLIPVFILVNLGLLLLGFLFIRQLYGVGAGIAFAFLLAISGAPVQSFYFTSNSQVMLLDFLCYLFFLVLYIRKGGKFLPYLLFFVGLGFQFESAFAIMLIPLTILAVFVFRHLLTRKQIVSGVGLFFLPLLTFILFDLRHEFLMTHAVIRLLTGQISVSAADQKYQHFGIRLADRLQALFASFSAMLTTPNQLFSLFLFCVLACALFLILRKRIKRQAWLQEEKEFIFLLLFLIVAFSLYLLYPLSLQHHFVQALDILAVLLVVLALTLISRYRLGVVLGVIFFLLISLPVISSLFTQYSSFLRYHNTSSGTFKNQLAVVDWVYRDSHNKPFGYFVYDAPIVTYGMDYLMWWRGIHMYHRIADSQKHPITYLILFPQPAGDLHAHDFWIKNTVRTEGRVLTTKQFPSQIIVEKLAVPVNDPMPNPNYYQDLLFR